MKENTLFVLKEVAICIGIAIIAVGLNVFLFKDYIVANVEVEDANTKAYAAIKKETYAVKGTGVESAQNPTQKYETVDGELDLYTEELKEDMKQGEFEDAVVEKENLKQAMNALTNEEQELLLLRYVNEISFLDLSKLIPDIPLPNTVQK